MASGERSQTWFPELVTCLRQSWRDGLDWPGVIALRDELQVRLESILASRGITPAVVRCHRCGTVGPGRPPVISVRALLLALPRFQVVPAERARSLEKTWAKYRASHNLDLYGKAAASAPVPAHVHGDGVAS